MMRCSNLLSVLLCASLCTANTAVFAADFYKWVLPDGSTRYSQTPPPKAYATKAKKVTIITHTPSASTTTASNTTTAPAVAPATAAATPVAVPALPNRQIPQTVTATDATISEIPSNP